MEALIFYKERAMIHVSARHEVFSFCIGEDFGVLSMSKERFFEKFREEGETVIIGWPEMITSRAVPTLELTPPAPARLARSIQMLSQDYGIDHIPNCDEIEVIPKHTYNYYLNNALYGQAPIWGIPTTLRHKLTNLIMKSVADTYHSQEQFHDFCQHTGLPIIYQIRTGPQNLETNIVTQTFNGKRYRIISHSPEQTGSYVSRGYRLREQYEISRRLRPTGERDENFPPVALGGGAPSNVPSSEGAATIRGQSAQPDTQTDALELLKEIEELLDNEDV